MTTGAYDNPNYHVRWGQSLAGDAAGGAGTAVYCRTPIMNDSVLHKARAVVMVAGTTSGANSGFDLMHGTTSIGGFTLSTSAAGAVVSISDLNRSLTAGDVLSIRSRVDLTVRATAAVELVTAQGASWD